MEADLTPTTWITEASEKVKLIGEIGANHQGKVELALRLVRLAASLGVDCVKGQLRDLDAYRHRTEPYSGPHAFGPTYYEHRCALELPMEAHHRLAEAAREAGAEYSVSVWQASRVADAVALGARWLKIPSACLTDLELLAEAGRTGLVVLLSTGMSTGQEVADALRHLPEDRTVPLVCTSAYPCAPEDVHLWRLHDHVIRRAESCGVSGHWVGIHIDPAAVALGARIIERHITLDTTWRGTDHAASLGPHGMSLWVRAVRAAEASLGRQSLQVLECEQAARAKLRGGE